MNFVSLHHPHCNSDLHVYSLHLLEADKSVVLSHCLLIILYWSVISISIGRVFCETTCCLRLYYYLHIPISTESYNLDSSLSFKLCQVMLWISDITSFKGQSLVLMITLNVIIFPIMLRMSLSLVRICHVQWTSWLLSRLNSDSAVSFFLGIVGVALSLWPYITSEHYCPHLINWWGIHPSTPVMLFSK